jgi:hypothetical protein
VYRAFVVQLHATAVVAQGQLSGRVEHVLSGQAAHFQTLNELPLSLQMQGGCTRHV